MTCVAERRKESLQSLVDAGYLQPLKRGRPAIYQNGDERRAALKLHNNICSQRYGERVRAARALLNDSVRSTVNIQNVVT